METESHGSVESRSFGNTLRSIGRLFLPRGNANSVTKQRSVRSGSNVTSLSARSDRDAPSAGAKSKGKSRKRMSPKAGEGSTARSVQSARPSQTQSEIVDSPPSPQTTSFFTFMRRHNSKQQRASTATQGNTSSTSNCTSSKAEVHQRANSMAATGTVVVDVHALAGPSASVYSNSSADSSLHSAGLASCGMSKPQQSGISFGFGASQQIPSQSATITCDTEDELLANTAEKSSISLSSSVHLAANSNNGGSNQARGASGTFECPLCLIEVAVDSVPRLINCRHRACRNCLRIYLRTEITEGRVQIACPTCSERLHPTDIEQLLADQPRLVDKYSEFMVRRVLLNDPDARWCPAPDCGFAVIANACGACPRLTCERPGCGTQFCYHCKSFWHAEGQPCPALRFAAQQSGKERNTSRDRNAFRNPAALLRAAPSGLRELVDNAPLAGIQSNPGSYQQTTAAGPFVSFAIESATGGAAARTSWSAGSVAVSSADRGAVSEVKPCPRCGALIIKMQDGSCNHMTCILCGAEFCWLCLREISDWHYLSPSGCTFWGKRVWSRKKKILWQLGILVGAPVFIALIATVSVPAILIGVPIWVGKKLHAANATRSSRRRTVTVTAGVLGAVALSPVLATFAVSIGVPVLLAYVYGVIPISLCKSNACGAGGSLDDDEGAPPPLRFFEDDSALAHRSNALQAPSGTAANVITASTLGSSTSRVTGIAKQEDDTSDASRLAIAHDEPTAVLGDTPNEHRAAARRGSTSRMLHATAALRGCALSGTNADECDESAIVSSVSVGDACSAAGSLGGPAILLGGDSVTADTASAGADDGALYLHAAAASKKRVTIGGQHCHPHSASFEYAEADTDADVDVPIDGVTVRVVQPADCDTDDPERSRDADPDISEIEQATNGGSLKKQVGKASRTRGAVRHASFSKRRDTRPSNSAANCLVQSPSSAGAPTMMSSFGDVSSCVSYSQIVAPDGEPSSTSTGDHDHRAASSCDKSDARGECAADDVDADADRESASRRALIGTSCEPSLNGDAASMRSGKIVLTPSDADEERRVVGIGSSKSMTAGAHRDDELGVDRSTGETLTGASRQQHAATPTMLTSVGTEYDDAALLTQDNASTKCLPGSLLINMDTFSIRDTSIALDDASSLNNVLTS